MFMSNSFLSRLAVCAALAAPLLAQADPRYTVTAIGGAGSRAFDLNNSGQTVGYIDVGGGVSHAFLYSGGALTDLGTLGGARSNALGINASGQVVGWADNASTFMGFIYSGGVMSAIPNTEGGEAAGINNAGTVVGTDLRPDSNGILRYHAYSYSGGVMTDLGTLPYGDSARAAAINAGGNIVGAATNTIEGAPNFPETSFFYSGGVMTDLGNFGGIYSKATSINDHGQIVGYSGTLPDPLNGDIYPQHAFLYEGGVLHDLGSLLAHTSSAAFDINKLGQIVGSSGGTTFLYEAGAMTDLNTLIDPAAGWTVTGAMAINDMQQIAGTACKGGDCFAVRLDLVSAVPEPATWGMLLAGCALLGLTRRHTAGRPAPYPGASPVVS
jgi:probable HAF family extracellular repeat protein